MNKKKNILLILLLLLIIIVAIFLFFKKKKTTEHFTLQGQTEIGAGKISLKVWDDNTEDGDSVIVFFNGKIVKDTLAIKYEPEIIQLGDVQPGEYKIGIKAINEGMSSPATAAIAVSNGKTEETFSMYATMDSAAAWNLIVK
ncbi:MAG: hypothetical protein ABI091_13630 [Ferruginibacter sp.]